MCGWNPAGFPQIITMLLWVFWGKESTLLALRVGGETEWEGLMVVERGYFCSNSMGSIGIWSQSSLVLMGSMIGAS